jgi:hypothetical protein
MATNEETTWDMSCTNIACAAYGMVFPTQDDSIQCGACGIVYDKPE